MTQFIYTRLGRIATPTYVRMGGRHLLQARVRENDSMVHDAIVIRKLSKLLLLSWDVEKRKGYSLDNVMTGVYPGIVRVSTSQLCSSQCTNTE